MRRRCPGPDCHLEICLVSTPKRSWLSLCLQTLLLCTIRLSSALHHHHYPKNMLSYLNNEVARANEQMNGLDQPFPIKKSTGTDSSTKSIESEGNEEHPLRTDEWLIEFHIPFFYRVFSAFSSVVVSSISRKMLDPLNLLPSPPQDKLDSKIIAKNIKKLSRCKQIIKFHPNGYVLVLEDSSKKKTKVGKWKAHHGKICWEIPVKLSPKYLNHKETNQNVRPLMQLQYTSNIHLNNFGKMPRMFRGVITRDR